MVDPWVSATAQSVGKPYNPVPNRLSRLQSLQIKLVLQCYSATFYNMCPNRLPHLASALLYDFSLIARETKTCSAGVGRTL